MLHNHKSEKEIPLLQVALDFETLDDAIAIAEKVAPFVDVLEAGTPLIKSEGIRAVRALKRKYPKKLICADLKTADAGYLEVRMAAQAEADIVTILADAYNITIEEALRAAHEFRVDIMADLIMSRSPSKRLANITNLNYKSTKIYYALVHSGLDRQASRRAPLSELKSVSQIKNRPQLAVAGGIVVNDISKLSVYPLGIIIVGGGITRVKDPNKAAENIRNAIYNYFS
ncbi:MAG: 3-hexulose-6-phosphate synthase [Promethearchaeota archaeon]